MKSIQNRSRRNIGSREKILYLLIDGREPSPYRASCPERWKGFGPEAVRGTYFSRLHCAKSPSACERIVVPRFVRWPKG